MLPYTTNPNAVADESEYTYDLSSAVVHKGKLDAGHYYVYCRQGEEVSRSLFTSLNYLFESQSNERTQWMLFNDDQVTPVTEADVLGVDAYLLFYNLRCLANSAPTAP